MKTTLKTLVTLTQIIFPFILTASEIDSWVNRRQTLARDPQKSLTALNQFTNSLLYAAMAEQNRLGKGCDYKEFYDAVYKKVSGPNGAMTGAVEGLVSNTTTFDGERFCVGMEGSVYRDLTIQESLLFNTTDHAFGCTLNINGNVVGSDKFGHFFAQGFTYFRKVYAEKQGLAAALDYGDYSEKTYFGLQTTGVYSFGDLAANYEGLNFWSQLTDKYADKENSLFYCENNQWVPNKMFKWEQYVSSAWDEAKNPNFYNTPAAQEKVTRNIEREGLQMPLDENSCKEVAQRYGGNPLLAKNIISPHCARHVESEYFTERGQDLTQFGGVCWNPRQITHSAANAVWEVGLKDLWWKFQ